MAIAPAEPGNAFGNNVTFACSGLPAGATCSFSPTQINAGGKATTVTITVQTAGPFTGPAGGVKRGNARHSTAERNFPSRNHRPWLPLSVPMAGIVFVGLFGRSLPRRHKIVGLCLTLVLAGFL